MIKYYVVHAFTETVFHGNPAGVCVLDKPVSVQLMQKIAAENHLPETAFLLKDGQNFSLRWFTPLNEIDLCGHATLAAAYVVFHFMDPHALVVEFQTMSGSLRVCKNHDRYDMRFPVKFPEKITPSAFITERINVSPVELYSERDLYVVLENEEKVLSYEPDYTLLAQLNQWLGIVLTAKGKNTDFVSRYFCPELREDDPVTGSSHCSLIPLWAKKLHKDVMVARQLSGRQGILYCENRQNEVIISGNACLYLQGELNV